MWVVPGKFLFSHCPKTGGTAFRKNIEKVGVEVVDISLHGKLETIPEEYRHLPIIAISREPSQWIASLYRYRNLQESIGGPGAWNNEIILDRSRGSTCSEFASNVSKNHLNLLSSYDEGYMVGATHIIEFDRLEEEAVSVIGSFGIEIDGFKKFNQSYRGELSEDDTLSVEEALKFNSSNMNYCEKYGYPLPEGERYCFSEDWSGWIDTTFKRYVASIFRGVPVNYLEVGICEGGGAVKFFNPSYFHPTSKYYGYDIWMWNPRHRAERNISLNSGGRHHIWDSRSQAISRDYEIIYIDADHSAEGCMKDSVDLWKRLKDGGVMIWDDYGCPEVVTDHKEVKPTVDTFLDTVSHRKISPPSYYQKVVQKIGT
jgi:hypothetical protein